MSKGYIFKKCANGRGLGSCRLCEEFPCESLTKIALDMKACRVCKALILPPRE